MSRKTEKFGRREIEDFIDSSDILDSFFEVNDKTPCWDGSIFVYSKPAKGRLDLPKSSFHSRIPTQIKGVTVGKLDDDITRFTFDRADIENYYKDEGVILFVVEKNEDGKSKIFYCSLVQWDLKKVLKEQTEDTVIIDLRHISKEDIYNFEDIVENFIINRKKQTSVIDIDVSREKVKTIEIPFSLWHQEPITYMLNNEVYVYGKYNTDDPVPLVLDKIKPEIIVESMESKIAIDDKVYFRYMEVKHLKNRDVTYYEDCIEVYDENRSLRIKIIENGDIDKQIKAYTFFLALIKKKYFMVNDKIINLENRIEFNLNIDKLESKIRSFKNIVALLDVFKIEHSRLNISQLDESDIINLNSLISIMIYNNEAREFKGIPGRFRYKIGKLSLLVMIYKSEKGKIIFLNYANVSKKYLRITAKANDGTEIEISKYLGLSEEDIIEFDNILPELFYDDIIQFDYSDYYNTLVTDFILKLILVYDKVKNMVYLDVCLNLIEWLEQYDKDNPVNVINYMQIKYRKNELTKEDIAYIGKLIESEKEFINYDILQCCIFILLKERKKFDKAFLSLEEDKQEAFKKYPIYNLL